MNFKGDFFLGHPVEGVPSCTMQWKAKFWNYAKSAFCSHYSETGHCQDGRKSKVIDHRPAQFAGLSRSKFDPELFSHSVYVKFFVTFATNVPYLTFCDNVLSENG